MNKLTFDERLKAAADRMEKEWICALQVFEHQHGVDDLLQSGTILALKWDQAALWQRGDLEGLEKKERTWIDLQRDGFEPIKVVCAWCKKHLKGLRKAQKVSHGICKACKTSYDKER